MAGQALKRSLKKRRRENSLAFFVSLCGIFSRFFALCRVLSRLAARLRLASPKSHRKWGDPDATVHNGHEIRPVYTEPCRFPRSLVELPRWSSSTVACMHARKTRTLCMRKNDVDDSPRIAKPLVPRGVGHEMVGTLDETQERREFRSFLSNMNGHAHDLLPDITRIDGVLRRSWVVHLSGSCGIWFLKITFKLIET